MTQTPADASSPRRNPRIAANPIPYWSRDGRINKSKEVFDEAFADFADIGFTAVKADVPEGMPVGEYADWIGSYGLAPSLSLFSSPFDETINIVDEVERAKRFAADQVALGLDRTMVSSMTIPARMAQPAVGADFDKDRFELRRKLRDRLSSAAKVGSAPTPPFPCRRCIRNRRRNRAAARNAWPRRHRGGPGHGTSAVVGR